MAPAQLAELQQIGAAYFLYLFLYSGMEFTLTFLTHIRFSFTPMQQVGDTPWRRLKDPSCQRYIITLFLNQVESGLCQGVMFSIQGRMFLFVGIVMAVLQGGIVRRIPQGKERKAAMG